VIITRTPLRISLAGGGTDLPSYYRDFGGFVISAAINKYVYISINETFFPGYLLKYSEFERAATLNDIRHPFIREALRIHGLAGPLEIVSIADVPAGTGMGSSGSFLTRLLHALHAYKRQPTTAEALAREAVEIEINRLNRPVGKQDQYIAAYGGLLCQTYRPDDAVTIEPLQMTERAIRELRDSLMLFFVGQTRSATELLLDQKLRSENGEAQMLQNLHFMKELGAEIRKCLESGDIAHYGLLMHEHWRHKRMRSAHMSNRRIDQLYELTQSRGGASGGKLVGAGGSGFLLFHTSDRCRLRTVLHEAGVREMDFSFDFDGSVVILRNS
jgi:D-glycero-alpha-D-manno-heptose-7-phosphate kinase